MQRYIYFELNMVSEEGLLYRIVGNHAWFRTQLAGHLFVGTYARILSSGLEIIRAEFHTPDGSSRKGCYIDAFTCHEKKQNINHCLLIIQRNIRKWFIHRECLKKQQLREAVGMAFHSRLGQGADIKCLGRDMLAQIFSRL